MTVSCHRLRTPTQVTFRWHLTRTSYTIANPPLRVRHVCVIATVRYPVTVALVTVTPYGTTRPPHDSASISVTVQTSLNGCQQKHLRWPPRDNGTNAIGEEPKCELPVLETKWQRNVKGESSRLRSWVIFAIDREVAKSLVYRFKAAIGSSRLTSWVGLRR